MVKPSRLPCFGCNAGATPMILCGNYGHIKPLEQLTMIQAPVSCSLVGRVLNQRIKGLIPQYITILKRHNTCMGRDAQTQP